MEESEDGFIRVVKDPVTQRDDYGWRDFFRFVLDAILGGK